VNLPQYRFEEVNLNSKGTVFTRMTAKAVMLFALIFFVNISFSQVLVKDINPGGGNGLTYYPKIVNSGSLMFFAATSPDTGEELWKSDGTTAGTMLVKDIAPGLPDSYIRFIVDLNGIILFSAQTTFGHYELWRSDGTAAGTVMVKDIYPGTESSDPRNLTLYNGNVYFSATNGVNGVELWKSDGTAAGTVMVKDIYAGASGGSPKNFTVYKNELYFQANPGFSGYYGNTLWKTNGTTAGTVQVRPSSLSSPSYPENLIVVNNTLFFTSAPYGDKLGIELWKTDGTGPGTVIVSDINPGVDNGSSPRHLTDVNGVLYFFANNLTSGVELYKSDGTAAGTILVKDINPGPANGYSDIGLVEFPTAVIGNSMIFRGNDGLTGVEIWKTDGTATGTIMLKDIYPGEVNPTLKNSSNPDALFNYQGKVYFRAYDPATHTELWETDGTIAGTKVVNDLCPGQHCGGIPAGFNIFNNTLYFGATDASARGFELWKLERLPVVLITSFTPLAGKAGTVVTINGSGFSPTLLGNTIKFNGVLAVVTSATAASITTSVPPGATTGKISVTVSGVTVASATDFIIDNAAPIVTTYLPADNATAIPINANLIIRFNEKIEKGTGNILIKAGGVLKQTLPVSDASVTIVDDVVTINPADFMTNSVINIEMPAGVFRDVVKNDFAGILTSTTWNFTSSASADNAGPSIVTLSPADNATGVLKGSNLIITFNENVLKGSGNILIKEGGVTTQTINVTDARVAISGASVTIDPSDFGEFKAVNIEMAAGVFKDLANNNFAGITTASGWNFTTLDVIPPSVLALSPADNSTLVPVASNLVITFNENVQRGAGSFLIKENGVTTQTIAVTGAFVTVSGATVTINPTDFTAGAAVNIEMPQGILKDMANNSFAGITSNVAWNFTVLDATAPIVVKLMPADNSSEVAANSDLVLTFSENVQSGSGNFLIKEAGVTKQSIAVTDPAVSISGATVTINADNFTGSASVNVEMPSGIVKDMAGNNYAGITNATSWNFSVEFVCYLTKPVISSSGRLLTSSIPTGNQWLKNGIEIVNATGNTYDVTESGEYSVRVTGGGCSLTSDPVMVLITGVEDSFQALSIYPNPTSSIFIVEADDSQGFVTIEVYSLLGVKIKTTTVPTGESGFRVAINLGDESAGIYILVIKTDAGEIRSRIEKR